MRSGPKPAAHLAPTSHPTMIDIAWAAGLWEGEGCITAGQCSEQLVVIQKDTWILHRLRSLFGGAVITYQHPRCSQWYVTGPRARAFAFTIFTFLSPRRRQQVIKNLRPVYSRQHGVGGRFQRRTA